MAKFKPGDKVLMLSSSNTSQKCCHFKDGVQPGEVATVRHYYLSPYFFVEGNSYMYHEDDFELFKEPQVVDTKQVGGSHYLKAIQPWDIIKAWDLDFWRGNVIKYVLRAPFKNGVEDIDKAIHYLEYIKSNYKELFRDGV